jgi:hypothetical protein
MKDGKDRSWKVFEMVNKGLKKFTVQYTVQYPKLEYGKLWSTVLEW